MLEPPRAGLTNSGYPRASTRSRQACWSVAHWRAVTVTDGSTGSPAASRTTFM